jgi:hypothetical protein
VDEATEASCSRPGGRSEPEVRVERTSACGRPALRRVWRETLPSPPTLLRNAQRSQKDLDFSILLWKAVQLIMFLFIVYLFTVYFTFIESPSTSSSLANLVIIQNNIIRVFFAKLYYFSVKCDYHCRRIN